MRKVLALLLACMLPFCALAETYGVSFAVDTDELLFINFLRTALMSQPDAASDPQLDTYVRVIQKLLHGLSFDLSFQEDAISLGVQLGGGKLLDAAFHEQDGSVFVTSSLLEGYALEAPAEADTSRESALQETIEQLDWHHISEAVSRRNSAWLDSLEPVITYGYFIGDAYEGGSQCITWALDDKDIASLVDAVLSEEVRKMCYSILKPVGLKPDELLQRLDSVNARVMSENDFQYLLRIVTDEQGTFVGASLAVYRETAQLATVSVGTSKEGLRVVFGFGVQEKNYWCELTASAKGRNNLTILNGSCLEWLSDKTQGFAYVKTTVVPVSNQSWYCNVTKSGRRYLWDASLFEGDKTNYAYYFSSSGALDPESAALECSVSIGDSPYTPLTVRLKAGPVEAIPEMEESLKRCAMTDPADAALYQELMERMTSLMMARLMKLIPLDLLLKLRVPQMP